MREQMLEKFGEMGLVGRIYIASEGINAQLSCPVAKLSELREYCNRELNLNDMEFNYSTIHLKAFRKLNVKIRHQIVADGLEEGTYDLSNQPNHLTPDEWHKALSNVKKPITLIDMRNHYESEIGYFENAIRPDVDTFRDGIKIMNEICEGKQDEEIYMYCTGKVGFDAQKLERFSDQMVLNRLTFLKEELQPTDLHNVTRAESRVTNIQIAETKVALNRTCGAEFCLNLVKAWDEKFGKPPCGGFDDVKPGGMECIYDHIHRTRPQLVIKRLGGKVANVPSNVIEKILEKVAEK
ncbi:14877_t:CDS:2 [Acaulospora colombiana]|uniref:14877_t:CDS:1 n=1 Tax=Acaulospora colombiana TaxID=27376 RepID=A0ACA9L2G6_9GLOM|nr:14877_t:CDS:2 [Acaulospora colombiana]